ncbi:MAG: aminodeoxychorismate/anthranilate synthase component II [Elusimicrobiales bacterium]|nr:aminodeoxychorismate/anthranilate synthase component II [Elusimicrobiales bacterium]
MILFIDNYDSFTYNLVQYFGEIGQEIEVFRNDKITLFDIERKNPDYIVISPGPCTPSKAGISLEVIRYFSGKIPLLGICLGHQAMAQAFGGKLKQAEILMHGKSSDIYHSGGTIFNNIPSPYKAIRYHSIVADKKSFPSSLEVTAQTKDGEIMALRHKKYAVEGVQFHPEAILTEYGKELLKNFINHYARK